MARMRERDFTAAAAWGALQSTTGESSPRTFELQSTAGTGLRYDAWPVSRKYVLLLAVAGGVLIADQAVKFAVLDSLTTAFDGKDGGGAKLAALYGAAPAPAFPEGLHYRQKRSITVSESFLRIRYAENPGAAWGLFRTLPEGVRGPLFHVVSIGAIILILYYFRKLSGTDPTERWALWGLPLVLGGAIGNYMDRLARGFVVDFIEAHWFDNPSLTWPSFNIADSAICIGVGMLVLDALVRKEKKPVKNVEEQAPTQ
jgi:signal peptidase II